jgi:cytochrome c oxidase accessory protein FixG
MASEEALYQKRIPIFPRSVKGHYRTLKYLILFFAYAVYFLLPWLPWSRPDGPSQCILFDLVERRFYLFNLTVYAQDIFWLAGFLIVGAFLLFFVTGIAGRVFCGYFCFQTLWTDVYQLIERLVQGERNARMKLAAAPWGANKIIRMSLTWLLWLLVAFWTGFSFTLYWSQAPVLFVQFFTGHAPFPAYATTLFLTATTFVMAGLAREQVCTYMCPYARFQSAMFDSDTLIVAYDEQRGERSAGRAKPVKGLLGQQERIDKGAGDCIDCGYCVQVCPVGIDIRNGMQYQCISCALCVDACNTIMSSIKYPTGLIRYTSENQLQGKRTNWFKLKNIGYAVAILIVIGLLTWSISHRAVLEMSVHQVRQPLYVMLSDGSIQNRYTIKINNKLSKAVTYNLTVRDLPGAQWEVRPSPQIKLGPGESASYEVRVWLKPVAGADDDRDFMFVLTHELQDKALVSKQVDFYIPHNMR